MNREKLQRLLGVVFGRSDTVHMVGNRLVGGSALSTRDCHEFPVVGGIRRDGSVSIDPEMTRSIAK